MLVKHEVSNWDHLNLFSDQELMFWLKAYRDHYLPKARDNKRKDPEHFDRCLKMLGSLELKATLRGLI